MKNFVRDKLRFHNSKLSLRSSCPQLERHVNGRQANEGTDKTTNENT